MRDHMRAELTIAALTMAIQQQKPPPGLIHHSDRGSQYAAADYRKVLMTICVLRSMPSASPHADGSPRYSAQGPMRRMPGRAYLCSRPSCADQSRHPPPARALARKRSSQNRAFDFAAVIDARR
jgi:hypothetical protein